MIQLLLNNIYEFLKKPLTLLGIIYYPLQLYNSIAVNPTKYISPQFDNILNTNFDPIGVSGIVILLVLPVPKPAAICATPLLIFIIGDEVTQSSSVCYF